ncbi:hypothetical protein TNCV_1474371 [Trichonephila clavipes]|nr:hypothetical protein TNCV_1474371 [Trichonephila clavipes]
MPLHKDFQKSKKTFHVDRLMPIKSIESQNLHGGVVLTLNKLIVTMVAIFGHGHKIVTSVADSSPGTTKPRHVGRLVHIKSVEVHSPRIDLVWKFEEWDVN